MKVGIIGTNLMGRRRAASFKAFPETVLAAVSSARPERATAFASEFGGQAFDRWQDLLAVKDLDAVLVCTPVHLHHEIVLAALAAGKHVLCEKPLTRTLEEAEALVVAAKKAKKVLKCGFNHRYHPAIQQSKKWLDEGFIGKLHFIRCRYGICGRPGYEGEWRMDKEKVGGGHLMEHGIHAIDLFRWFLGDLTQAAGFTASYVVGGDGLEDNAVALFRNDAGQVAQLHSSLTQWRNLFSFEIYGEDGYINVDGLGGSYGTEKATRGKKSFDKPFQEETLEFRGDDTSWKDEWKDFLDAIKTNKAPLGTGEDGLEAIRLVNAVYESSAERRWSQV